MLPFNALYPPMLIGSTAACMAYQWPVFILLSIVMVFDTIARYKDYKAIVACTNPQKELVMVRYCRTSWCTRTAAMAASPEAKVYYRARGYKWYHLLPDNFFKRAMTLRFWTSLTGLKKVKISFKLGL